MAAITDHYTKPECARNQRSFVLQLASIPKNPQAQHARFRSDRRMYKMRLANTKSV